MGRAGERCLALLFGSALGFVATTKVLSYLRSISEEEEDEIEVNATVGTTEDRAVQYRRQKEQKKQQSDNGDNLDEDEQTVVRIGSTAAAATSTTAAASSEQEDSSVSKNKKKKEKQRDMYDEDTEQVLPADRFPWEPKTTTTTTTTTGTTTTASAAAAAAPALNKKIDARTLELAKSHMEQLEFLGAMTFANGGLRAPICLCCQ